MESLSIIKVSILSRHLMSRISDLVKASPKAAIELLEPVAILTGRIRGSSLKGRSVGEIDLFLKGEPLIPALG
jgi:hypothetical protein